MFNQFVFTNAFELSIQQKSKDFFITLKLLKPILKWCKSLIYNAVEVGNFKLLFQRLTSIGILSHILIKLLLSTNYSFYCKFRINTKFLASSLPSSIKSKKPYSLNFSKNRISSFIFIIAFSRSISSFWSTWLTQLTLSKIYVPNTQAFSFCHHNIIFRNIWNFNQSIF